MVNVLVKRRGLGSRHVGIRKTSESEPVGKASKQNYGGTKTGAYALPREQHGRYLLTGHAASGAEQA